ncbi:MAG: tetratricopeptide repeat protein [Saprospiraceae bacterium]
MPSPIQNLKEFLAQGNIEGALETLVKLTEQSEDTDLRQRVQTLSVQFARLKKRHLTGLEDEKYYGLEMNRITAAVVEIVDKSRKDSLEIEPPNNQKTGSSNDITTPPFWRKWRFWTWFIPVLISLAALFLAYPSFIADGHENDQYGSDNRADVRSANPGCGFPEEFDSTHLYILITRFEDNANAQNETKCYGLSIQSRIDEIKLRDSLPIKICYVDSLPPNQSDEAARMRDYYHADLIIWGKLRDAEPNCQADGFCIKFQPSETLVRYAGGQISPKVDNEYQPNISDKDLEEGLINMGKESFDAWVIGMSNLKIGRKKPEFYRIASDWSVEKQADEYAIRANMFFHLGLFEKAIQDYDLAINLRPLPVFYYERSVTYQKLGKFQMTISDCDKAIQLDSNYALAYNSRGFANSKLGQNEAAITDYNMAIKFNPNDVLAYNNRGGAKRDLGLYDAAISDFNKAIQLDSNDANVYNNRGAAKFDLKLHGAAIADYDKAIRLDPKQSMPYRNRGVAKYALGQKKVAIADYDKAIQLDSNNIKAYDDRGAAKYHFGQYEEAVFDLDNYVQRDTKNSGVYYVRGVCKTKLGQFKSALADLNKAIQLDPKKTQAYTGRGDANNGLGQYEAALADFGKATQLMPNVFIHNGRGYAKIKLFRYKEAIADFDVAINTEPQDPDNYYNRGIAYWEQGNFFSATSDFWQSFRLRYLPGWRLYAVWTLIIGVFFSWRFRKYIKTFIQTRGQLPKKKTTRQEKRHPHKKKKP